MQHDVHIYYFIKRFLTFERFLVIRLFKYVFIFFLDFFVMCSLCNFLVEDLKNLKKYF
jgi:hypothetical protein